MQCRCTSRPCSPVPSGATLSYARTTTLVAAFVTLACLVAIAPIAAFGDDDPRAAAAASAVEQAIEVREDVEQVNEVAREQAPPAVGTRCDRTLEVEGIGDTCVARDGLLRVEQSDGRSHTIHGLDAPPVGASAFTPTSQAAVTGADASDITCVPASEPHYVLVYARPGDVASRYTTIAPLLRTETYKVSAFIDSESRSVDPAASKKLPLRCDGTEPTVLQATLSGLTSGSASFSQVVDGMRALGYQFNGDGDGLERYLVYYDSPSPSGAAGTGHVFTSDSSAGATNQNNKGGLYAVEYRFDGGGGVPHWEVLIHEVVHTMGAVVNAAPRSTTAGHCTDGQDIMCYQDGSGSSYSSSVCSTKILDCGRNDYFNPAPAAGSFLATHWNTAATYNRFLHHAVAADNSAPTQVVGLAQTGSSNSTIGVAWNPSSDDGGAPSYVVGVRSPGGAWRDVASTTSTSATVSALAASTTYEIGVYARDASGNATARAAVMASTNAEADVSAPARPSGIRVRQRPGKLILSWRPSGDNVGVARYEVRRAVSPTSRRLRAVGSTRNTTITVSTRGLRGGARYAFQLVARDDASNVSAATRIRVRIARDRARPTTPGRVQVRGRSGSSLTFQWNASRDNVGVRGYEVYQRVGKRWKKLRTVPARSRAIRVVRLRSRTAYAFRIAAIDYSNNRSRVRGVVTRTR